MPHRSEAILQRCFRSMYCIAVQVLSAIGPCPLNDKSTHVWVRYIRLRTDNAKLVRKWCRCQILFQVADHRGLWYNYLILKSKTFICTRGLQPRFNRLNAIKSDLYREKRAYRFHPVFACAAAIHDRSDRNESPCRCDLFPRRMMRVCGAPIPS